MTYPFKHLKSINYSGNNCKRSISYYKIAYIICILLKINNKYDG